jgi:DNA-binding HxlR family transcriptional regulator
MRVSGQEDVDMPEEGTLMSGTAVQVRMSPGQLSDRMQDIVARTSDKWCMLIVALLRDRALRYSELGRNIDGISQRMLTLSLRKLERDGLIIRTVMPISPPQVQYALSQVGRSLLAQQELLVDWALSHEEYIRASRALYDELSKNR